MMATVGLAVWHSQSCGPSRSISAASSSYSLLREVGQWRAHMAGAAADDARAGLDDAHRVTRLPLSDLHIRREEIPRQLIDRREYRRC